MNRFLRFYLLIAICVVPLSATTYYSQGNVAANTLANWNTLPAGGGSVPANFTTSGDSFVVQTGHSMTTSGAWTLASGVKLTVDSGATFTASHLLSSLGTFSVKNGGTYIHYATGSGTNGLAADFPGSTRILGATSTVEFRKWGNTGTGAVALPSGITWGNIIINVDTLFGSWNQTASITSVAGNLTVLKTGGGSREFRFTGSATLALSISGNVSVSGGIVGFSSGTGVPNVSISGNVNVTGGEFYFSNNSGVSPVVTVNGNVTVNGGTLNMQRSSPSYTTTILGDLTVNNSASILGIVRSSSSSKTFTLRLGGNFTHTAGSVEGTFGSNSVLVLHYKGGSPTVTMTETGTFPTATTNIIIDTGKTVTLNSAYTLGGSRTLTVNNGAVFGVGGAVTASSATISVNGTLKMIDGGSITGGTTTFGASDTLLYAGSTNRTTTNYEFPTTNGPGYVIINNPGGVKLHADKSIGQGLILTTGNLYLDNANLTIDSSAVITGGSNSSMVVATSAGALKKKFIAPGTFTFAVGDTNGTPEYSPLTLSFASGAFSSGYASVNVKNSKHPNNSSVSNYLNRYWTIASTGITAFSATVKAKYVQADVAGNESAIYSGKWNGSAWSVGALTDAANDTLTLAGISTFGDVTGGEQSAMGGSSTFTVKFIPEGFLDLGTGKLNMPDTFKVYLANVTSPYAFVDSARAILDTVTFTIPLTFTNAASGTYYIVVMGRNIIETWSKSGGIAFTAGAGGNYDFTTAANQAYLSNQILKGTNYCIYSGDVNQDGIVDFTDLSLVDNDSFNFLMGYLATDLSGDSIVDFTDLSIADNNSYYFVAVAKPGLARSFLK